MVWLVEVMMVNVIVLVPLLFFFGCFVLFFPIDLGG